MRNELTYIVLVQNMRRRSEYIGRNMRMGTTDLTHQSASLKEFPRNHDAASRANIHIASFILDIVLQRSASLKQLACNDPAAMRQDSYWEFPTLFFAIRFASHELKIILV